MKTLNVVQIADGSIWNPSTESHQMKHVYKVEKVTNSVTPNIMDRLTTSQLDKYCESDEWEVTIK